MASAAATSGGSGARSLEQLAQRRAAHELDDEVLLWSSSAETSNTSTMFGCRSFATALRLDDEAVRDLGRLAQVRMDHLDRDVAPKPLVRAHDTPWPCRRDRSLRSPRTSRAREGCACRPLVCRCHHLPDFSISFSARGASSRLRSVTLAQAERSSRARLVAAGAREHLREDRLSRSSKVVPASGRSRTMLPARARGDRVGAAARLAVGARAARSPCRSTRLVSEARRQAEVVRLDLAPA